MLFLNDDVNSDQNPYTKDYSILLFPLSVYTETDRYKQNANPFNEPWLLLIVQCCKREWLYS